MTKPTIYAAVEIAAVVGWLLFLAWAWWPWRKK